MKITKLSKIVNQKLRMICQRRFIWSIKTQRSGNDRCSRKLVKRTSNHGRMDEDVDTMVKARIHPGEWDLTDPKFAAKKTHQLKPIGFCHQLTNIQFGAMKTASTIFGGKELQHLLGPISMFVCAPFFRFQSPFFPSIPHFLRSMSFVEFANLQFYAKFSTKATQKTIVSFPIWHRRSPAGVSQGSSRGPGCHDGPAASFHGAAGGSSRNGGNCAANHVWLPEGMGYPSEDSIFVRYNPQTQWDTTTKKCDLCHRYGFLNEHRTG